MIGPVAIAEYFEPGVQQMIRAAAGDDLDIRFPRDETSAAIGRLLESAEYAISRGTAIRPDQIEAAPHLKLIQCWGAGYDNVPLASAKARGIAVYRSAGVNAPSVADMTLALMLAVLRRVPQTDKRLRSGEWAMGDLWETARDLDGARVGLIGFGDIAQRVARRLSGFDCDVTYWRRSGPVSGGTGRYVELDDLLQQSDIVSLHIPLSDGTRGFLCRDRLFSMRPGAVLINTARGEIVDEAALVEALNVGHLSGCGLDVFSSEPVSLTNPLFRADNVILTPHVGGRTRQNFDRIVRHLSENVRAFAQGRDLPPGDMVYGGR